MRLIHGIRLRLLGLALAAVLPLAAVTMAALWLQWRSDRAVVAAQAVSEARLLAAQVDDHISDIESLLTVLGQVVSWRPADRDANNALLRRVKGELSNLDSHIFVLDRDGTNIGTSADPDDPPPNARDRAYFRAAMAGQTPAVGEPILARKGHWILNVAYPIRDAAGEIRAVVTTGPLLEHFEEVLRLHRLPARSVVTITNAQGVVVAGNSFAKKWIGQRVGWTHWAERMAAEEGSDVTRWSMVDNVERVNGFAMARQVPWQVRVGVPTDIAYAVLARRLKWDALAVAGSLALAFTIAWLLSGRMVRPLRQLGSDAAMLAAGNLGHRTSVRTRDEVGALAVAFNRMAQALDDDIAERKAAEEKLRKLAHYDQLTGLPNRTMLHEALARLLANDRTPVSVVLFDLDEFKDVNDTLGHSSGDKLLSEVGARLVGVAEERAVVGLASRLGGDEFVVLLPGCGDPRLIGEIVQIMLKRLNDPFFINEQQIHLGASAGVAIAPQDGTDVDELIANADLALYQAKAAGGRILRFFTPVLRAQAQARRSLDLELRRACIEGEFELYFQPQIRLSDNAVVGAEALLRWRHPQRGVLAPGAFIEALAESTNATAVGRWVMRTACAQAVAWRAAGLPLGRVGVNLFPQQAYDEVLAHDVMQVLADCGLPAEALELEITENIALNRDNSAGLKRLHQAGVKLAFDDFGTGYASLAYLTRLPLSRIKIDCGFIDNMTRDAQVAAIVRSLIAMAHNLDLGVIAEGVETPSRPRSCARRNARKRKVISTQSRCRRRSSRPICEADRGPRGRRTRPTPDVDPRRNSRSPSPIRRAAAAPHGPSRQQCLVPAISAFTRWWRRTASGKSASCWS